MSSHLSKMRREGNLTDHARDEVNMAVVGLKVRKLTYYKTVLAKRK